MSKTIGLLVAYGTPYKESGALFTIYDTVKDQLEELQDLKQRYEFIGGYHL